MRERGVSGREMDRGHGCEGEEGEMVGECIQREQGDEGEEGRGRLVRQWLGWGKISVIA